MCDWQTQVDKLLEDYEGITRERYTTGLASFRAWYLQSYSDEPDAALLTDAEVRDYRVYLTGVKGYKAATANAYPRIVRGPRSNAQGQGREAGPEASRCAGRARSGAAHQRCGWPALER
jgi:hypothetical protein